MHTIDSLEQLETVYGKPLETSLVKVTDHVTVHYATFIAASPFVALATSGPEGLDCSPRGDQAGFVRIANPKTLLLPDRRGNNRVDSLSNIVRDPRVALLFLVPGVDNTLRVNGRATLSVEPALLESFVVDGKAPRSVMVIDVREVYFQCARALLRSELWNPQRHVDPKTLPTPGEMLASLSNNRVGGKPYDETWQAQVKSTLW